MADIYGSTLDSLMQNRVAQQQADAAEANSYRNYLNQVANTNLRRQDLQDTNAYRWGDLGVRRELGLGQTAAYRDVGLGQSSAYRDVGLGQSGAYRDVGLANAAAHEKTGIAQSSAYRDVGMAGAGAQRDVGLASASAHRDVGMASAGAQRDVGMAGAGAQRDVGMANASAHLADVSARERLGMAGIDVNRYIAGLGAPVSTAQARLINAQADQLGRGGVAGMDPNMRMLYMSEAGDQAKAANMLPFFQQLLGQEEQRILGGKGGGRLWGNTDEYDNAVKSASTLPGGATPENIRAVAQQSAYAKVISGMKTYGGDPTRYTYHGGKIMLGASPFQQGFPGNTAPDPYSPADQSGVTNRLDSGTPPPANLGTNATSYQGFLNWKNANH